MRIWLFRLVILLLVSAGTSLLIMVAYHQFTQEHFPAWPVFMARDCSLDLTLERLFLDIEGGRPGAGEEVARSLESRGVGVFVLDDNGKPLLNAEEFSLRKDEVLHTLGAGIAPNDWAAISEGGEDACALGAYKTSSGRTMYVGLISTSTAGRGIDRVRSLSRWVGLLVGIVVLLTMTYLTEKPARRLRTALQGISKGDYSIRLDDRAPSQSDALSRLMEDFNVMADSLAKSYRAQQLFIGEMSHEMRVPQRRMVLAAEMVHTVDQQKSKKLLKQIYSDSMLISKILEQIMILSRASICGANFKELDLQPICERVIESTRLDREMESKTLELQIKEHPRVLGRQEYLESIIENLVLNAVKYTRDHTKVTVTLDRVTRGGASQALIEVQDQGPGIPEEDLAHVFEPYFRSSSSSRKKGYGLGLTIAQHLTALHGGEIKLFNLKGKGLLVQLFLPSITPRDPARTPA